MRNVIYYLSILFLLGACQNNQDASPVPNKTAQLRVATSEFTIDDVVIKEGVLKFQDKVHLRNVAQKIKDAESFSVFEGKSGFYSLLARQKSVTEVDVERIAKTKDIGEFADLLVFRGEDDDVSLEPIVGDKRYAALFNEKSIVVVGDTAYRIGFADLSAIEIAANPEHLGEFKKNPNMVGTTHTKIVRERKSVPNARLNGMVVTPKYKQGGKWFRFCAKYDRNYAVIYTSLSVKVTHERRSFWIWSLYGTTKVGFVNGTGTYWMGSQSNLYSWSGSQVNYGVSEANVFVGEYYTSDPFQTMDWAWGSAIMDCVGRNNATYIYTFSP